MRSAFRRSAKRGFIPGLLSLLIAVSFCMFLPRNGFTSNGLGKIELAIKNIGEAGRNDSALWVTNLGTRDAKVSVRTGPSNSIGKQEQLQVSEVIPGGATVRLDDSLPATFRSSEMLFIRSTEAVAALLAPADFPVQDSEFYSPPSRRQEVKLQPAPKWVREVKAIGTTGANVFKADAAGYAPVVEGQDGSTKEYVFGVGIGLGVENSSVELQFVNKAGQAIKSLSLASSNGIYWRAKLGEFIGGTDDFPNRVEMKTLAGEAQGFLSMMEAESEKVTFLPLAPMASGFQTLSGNGGYAYFSNGIYDSRYTSYTYNVYGAPPNVCGTLHIVRNGNAETGPGWICTNGSGAATKGPWTGSVNQTGQNIHIQWPDNSTTVGGDYKVDDGSDPVIWSNQTPGIGVPIPNHFSGGGSDAQWGTGFKLGGSGWSSILGTFREIKSNGTSKYYNGQGYLATSPVQFPGNASPPAGGFNLTWSVTSPPIAAHNSTDTYEWCVYSGDYFYPCFNCIYFYGPR